MRTITFALAKGRLAKKFMGLLAQSGINVPEMSDPSTRKLIFEDKEHGLRFFLAKPSDVPTYVEYGVADIGVCGKDTLMEEGRKLYEVLDLGIGKCRMCVCGPESAASLLHSRQLKENGLLVLEEVCQLSAKVIVNQVSMKMESERIGDIIQSLRRIVH